MSQKIVSQQIDKFAISAQQEQAGIKDRDHVHRFIFSDKPVQGLWINVNKSLTDALEHQPKYPVSVVKLLGELMLVASMFRYYMKTEGEINLSIQSQGSAVNTLLINVSEDAVRCVARVDDNIGELDPNAKLEDLIHTDARLILTVLEPNQKPYQSIIQVNLNSIQQSIIDFYKQSVQIPIYLHIASEQLEDGSVNCSAFFMQYIPDDSGTLEDFVDVCKLTGTLTTKELLRLSAEDLLYRLCNQENVKHEYVKPLTFKCTCSRQKMLDTISAIDDAEIDSIMADLQKENQQGDEVKISVACNCCGNEFSFTRFDIAENKEKADPNSNVFINDDK